MIQKFKWVILIVFALGALPCLEQSEGGNQSALAQSSSLVTRPPTPPTLTDETDLGVTIGNGNSRLQTYSLKNTTVYKWYLNSLQLSGHYLRTISEGIESTLNWNAALRYDRGLSKSTDYFLAQGFESDIFAGYNMRINSDVGLRQVIQKTKNSRTSGEAGFRRTEEYLTSRHLNIFHFVRFYGETSQQWTQTFGSRLWIEYLQDIIKATDFLVNGEASVTSHLTGAFSLKTSFAIHFTNQPPAPSIVKTDTLLMTSLVIKI